VAEVKERYREIRADIARKTRGDRRTAKRLLAKYGAREKNRTIRAIYQLSKAIVEEAKGKRFGIAVENLKVIRKLYRRRNSQSLSFRARMNSWTFGELQRQVLYEAAWSGVPVKMVNLRGTSRNCPNCGSQVAPLVDRKLYCSGCDILWDRDVLASKNVMAATQGPAARPPIHEVMKERSSDAVGNLPSGKVENG
jgi:IS605 OrfB family transposase